MNKIEVYSSHWRRNRILHSKRPECMELDKRVKMFKDMTPKQQAEMRKLYERRDEKTPQVSN